MEIDRPRQRDTLDLQFLIVDAIGRETGEQNSDQRDKANDESQPDHCLLGNKKLMKSKKQPSRPRRQQPATAPAGRGGI